MQCNATYRKLDERGIAYEVIDVTQNEIAAVYVKETLGYLQAPVVETPDGEHWSGYRPDLIEAL